MKKNQKELIQAYINILTEQYSYSKRIEPQVNTIWSTEQLLNDDSLRKHLD